MHSQPSNLCVLLPNKNRLSITTGLKCTGQDVIDQVCILLGVEELCHFGLCIERDNEPVFLDLEKKLTTYFPNTWKKNASQIKEGVILHLRVQHHVADGPLILDEKVRSLYYFDLKDKVLSCQCYEQEGHFFQLAAYALQAELGDWKEGEEIYFNPQDHFPSWILLRRGFDYVTHHIPQLHKELAGVTVADAILLFIKEAYCLREVMYTFYKMKKDKKEPTDAVLLGLTLTGLHMFECVNGERHFLNEFTWSSIDRLSFKGRRFEIKADVLSGTKLGLYTPSTLHSQHLLKHISNSHRIHLNTKLSDRNLQLYHNTTDKRRYREVYIKYSTDPDTDEESENELPRLKSYLNKARRRLAGALPPDTGKRECGISSEKHIWKNSSAELNETELCVDEPEEMFVDGPDEMMHLTELLVGVSVDGPLFLPVSQWLDLTADIMK